MKALVETTPRNQTWPRDEAN